jgi:hypothetical protein
VSQVNRSFVLSQSKGKAVSLTAAGLLALMCVLMVSSARLKSPTMDEQNHNRAGLRFA